MKRMLKKSLLFFALVLCGVGYGFWTIDYTPTINPQTATGISGTPAYKFDISGLVPLSTSTTYASPPAPFWKVFFSLGDGRFWMGSKSDFDAAKFYYMPGTYHPYMEMTAAYDDQKDPKGIARNAVTVTSPSGASIPAGQDLRVTMGSKMVKLQSNRAPKMGNIVTYIITYENNACSNELDGTITFEYDKDVLTYTGKDLFGQESKLTGSAASQEEMTALGQSYTAANNTGNLSFSFSGLNLGSQRNIFLYFITNTTTSIGHLLNPAPKATITPGRCVSADGTATTIPAQSDEMTGQCVVASHDPNQKFSIEDHLTPFGSTEVTYCVMFQNDGSDKLNTVEIEDELDPLLVNQLPTPISSSSGQLGNPVWTNQSKRQFKFTITGLTLHGLHEVGYGTQFTEEDTKCSFKFKCTLGPNFSQYSCNALVNQAKVRFGCNPLMATNMAFTPIWCQGSAYDSVTACIKRDTSFSITPAKGDSIFSPSIIAFLQNQGFNTSETKFKWYPSSNLSNPFVMDPVWNGGRERDYVLVASKPCINQVIHFKLPDPCAALTIHVDASGVTYDGNCHLSGNLVATVTGFQGGSDQLLWNNCSTGVTTMTLPYEDGKTEYYFGVTDRNTGCSKEVMYHLNVPPCHGSPWDWWLYALVGVFIAGAALYLGFRLFRKQ